MLRIATSPIVAFVVNLETDANGPDKNVKGDAVDVIRNGMVSPVANARNAIALDVQTTLPNPASEMVNGNIAKNASAERVGILDVHRFPFLVYSPNGASEISRHCSTESSATRSGADDVTH